MNKLIFTYQMLKIILNKLISNKCEIIIKSCPKCKSTKHHILSHNKEYISSCTTYTTTLRCKQCNITSTDVEVYEGKY
jgi:hypothetical protein